MNLGYRLSSIADVAASLNCFESIVIGVSGAEKHAIVRRTRDVKDNKEKRDALHLIIS